MIRFISTKKAIFWFKSRGFWCCERFRLTLIGKSWKTHPEIFLKFSFSGSSHRPFYWKTHPIFFWNFNSGASHRPFYWKTHPLKIMSTYSVFFNSGASPRPFYWKTHPFEFWLKPYRICNIWSKCKSCHDIDPYKDSRTSKFCDRCNSATCSNHAKILCRQCFAS